jgi:hypothetical protein
MEYFRDEKNRIRAGFAVHAGKLLEQYTRLSEGVPASERYDATLAICILQSLLTNCWELIEAMRKHQKGIWSERVRDIPSSFGISPSCVKRNTFSSDPLELSYSEFIGHMRNAFSHPTYPEKPPKEPSTGYTTVLDGKGIISKFRFVDSDWVCRGEIMSKCCNNDADKVRKTAQHFNSKYQCGKLDVKQNSRGKYQIFRGDDLYLPVFEAELSIEALTNFAVQLANHLAQPTRENWDGKSVVRLVA